MPETALKMATALGTDSQPDLNSQAKWGILKPGTVINAGPPLFPRLDTKKKGGDKLVLSAISNPVQPGSEIS